MRFFLHKRTLIGIIFSEELAGFFLLDLKCIYLLREGGQGVPKKQRYFFNGNSRILKWMYCTI